MAGLHMRKAITSGNLIITWESEEWRMRLIIPENVSHSEWTYIKKYGDDDSGIETGEIPFEFFAHIIAQVMVKAPIVTSEQLADMQCSVPECDHTSHDGEPMYLHSSCHTGAGVYASFLSGVIHLECSECNKAVANFKIV